MPTNFERGRAELEVAMVFNASTLTGAYATNPMKLLTPRSRGLSVWTYTSSFGGGMVAGDQTRFDLRIRAGARCCVGTQSATKIYRNPARHPCGHATHAVVEEGAFLAFMPSPVQPFAGSSYSQRQTFLLAAGAGLALVDCFTAGRAACGERWAFDHFSSRNEVFAASETAPPDPDRPGSISGNGRPAATQPARPADPPDADRVFLDSVRLDAGESSLRSLHATGRINCFALLLLLGLPTRKPAADLLEAVGRQPVERRASLVVSASPVGDGAVLRVAGEEVEAVEAEVRRHLGFLGDLLGDLPWSRRW